MEWPSLRSLGRNLCTTDIDEQRAAFIFRWMPIARMVNDMSGVNTRMMVHVMHAFPRSTCKRLHMHVRSDVRSREIVGMAVQRGLGAVEAYDDHADRSRSSCISVCIDVRMIAVLHIDR